VQRAVPGGQLDGRASTIATDRIGGV